MPAAAREAAGAAERALRPGRLRLRAPGRGGAAAGRARRASPTPATTGSSCCCRATRRRGPTPRWPGASGDAAEFLAGARRRARSTRPGCGARTRGRSRRCTGAAPTDEARAEARAHEIAVEAGRAGLEPRWGRKVLELRPVGGGGKDAAVASLLAGDGLDRAVYAGDDRTDLDAFRRLRELREAGELETAVCVGVALARGAAGAAPRSPT